MLDYSISFKHFYCCFLGPLGMDIECIPVILLLLFSESRKENERGGLCGRVWCLNKVELIFTVLIHTSGILTPLTPLSSPTLLLLIPFCSHSVPPSQYITHL